jgi:drug/metabolite transporter (DMT)-like permease
MSYLTLIGPLAVSFAAFLWALDGIVLRPSLYVLPVTLVVLLEHAVAFFFMAPFLWKKRSELFGLKKADWGAFSWVVIFGGVLGTLFFTKALFYVSFVNLSIVILIQKLQPVFALLLAFLILKEKLPKMFFTWAGIAVVATYFVTFGRAIPDLASANLIAGLFALGAAFAWGSSTVFSKRALKNVSFQVGTYTRFGLTTLVMAIIVLTSGTFSQIGEVNFEQWRTFLIIAVISGGGAMLIYYFGLKKIKASVATICELVFPVSAIILEFLLHGNTLDWVQLIAAGVLLLAVTRVSLLQAKSSSSI